MERGDVRTNQDVEVGRVSRDEKHRFISGTAHRTREPIGRIWPCRILTRMEAVSKDKLRISETPARTTGQSGRANA